MNPQTPYSPVGAVTDLPPIPPVATPEPSCRLRRILLALAVVVALADLCFWGVNGMGFSVGVFFLALTDVILLSREKIQWTGTTVLLCVLMAGASFAAMIECGVSNTIALLTLTVAIAGETYFVGLESWTRWYSQGIALLLAPVRIFWLARQVNDALSRGSSGGLRLVLRSIVLCVPALVLALIFGRLLAVANGVVELWEHKLFGWIWAEIFDWPDFPRVAFWALIAFLALPLIRPAWIAPGTWRCMQQLGPLPSLLSTGSAIFSCAMILVVVNLLFLVTNVADAMFLWSGAPLPAGVSYHDYVHNGVNTLIFTVILTAIVLTGIFQQERRVAGSRLLKALALVWIAQNLLLLVNCALRLRNYIVDYELTINRESCLIFLLLVATGFVLLTVKILSDRSLPWLVGRCLMAAFIVFYVTQFLDLYGWSANYNVARAERRGWNGFDTNKLYEAGPAGWPAAYRAHASNPALTVLNLDLGRGLDTNSDALLARFDAKHWREFSLRAWWNRWAIEEKSSL